MSFEVAVDPLNSLAKNAAEINAALNSYEDGRGGERRLPRGVFPVAANSISWPDRHNVSLVGDGPGSGYEDSFAGTQLKFGSGAVGIDFSNITPAGPYALIRNLQISGNHLLQVGIKAKNVVHMEHIDVTKCLQAGIQLWDYINSTTLDKVSVIGNDNIGLWVGGNGATQNTIFSVRNLTSRANLVGVRIEGGMNFSFRDSVIESNYGNGLEIYRPDQIELSEGTFDNVWWEGNWRGLNGYAIVINSANSAYRPTNIKFRDCRVSVGGLAKAVNIISGRRVRFEDLIVNGSSLAAGGNGAIDLGAVCDQAGFIDSPTALVTDSGSNTWMCNRPWGISGGGSAGAYSVVGLSDASQTLTAAQMVNAICTIYPTANRTLTTPSAADLIAAMGGYVQNGSTDFIVLNRANNQGTMVTLAGGSGVTPIGNTQIDVGSGHWRILMSSPTTVQIYNFSAK